MKKRFMTALIVLFTLVFSLAIFAACGDEGGEGGGGNGAFSINEQTVTIGVGDTHTLMARANGKSVTWESSDSSVATIVTQIAARGTCVIRGAGKGTATLTAKTDAGDTATCTVTVEEVTLSLSAETLTLFRKADDTYESKTLTATVMRNGVAGSGDVTWKSSDESIVTVNNGVVTAHKIGSATITATLTGGSAKATCEVNVVWENMPDGWYELLETGSNGALETPGQWTWSGFVGTDDVHPELVGEGSTATGSVSFKVSGNTGWRWYGAQLFYKHAGTEANALVAGTVYKLTFKLESTADGAITVNDTDVEVKSGTQTVEVIYREAGGGNASISMALATHDKIRNNVNPIGQYEEGTITISDMKWEVYPAQELHAPTAFSVKDDGELLITDDNNDDTFEGYVIGFFEGDALEPSYTQPIMKPVAGRDILETMNVKDGKMYLDDSFVEDGQYTLKVKAYCGTALYAASPWSTVTVSHTVSHENGVDYKVLESYRDVDRGVGRYYVWSEWGLYLLDECSFKDNSLTLALDGESSWYSNQVYYDIPGLEADHLYEYQFTLDYKTSEESLAGRQFVINGQRIDVSSEEHHTYTIYFLYTGGLAVNMLLGQPTADWQGTVENGGLPQGTYTFSNITLRDMNEEGNGVMKFGDNLNDLTDQLMFWYAAVGDWAEWKATIDMRNISYTANEESDTGYSYHFNYKITPIDNQVCNWIFRLWYKNSHVTNDKQYHILLDIDASEAGDILVNGETVHLQAGRHTYKVYPDDATAALSISMATLYSMTGISDNGMDITFESIKWEEGGRQALQAPTGTSLDTATGAVTFSDPNAKAGVDHYEIGFFGADGNTPVATQTVAASGEKINESVLTNGEYTVKIRFCGDADHLDTEWVTLGTYTVTKGSNVALGGQADAVAHKGTWYLWADRNYTGSNVTLLKTECPEDGKKVVVSYRTDGVPSLGYSVQLFYEDPNNVEFRTYNLSIKIKLSVAGTITFNGKQYTFTAGEEKTIELIHTEKGYGGEYNEGASFAILMGVGEGTPVMSAEITVSDWSFTEFVPKKGDMIPTELGEGQIPADSYWYYYSQYDNSLTDATVHDDGSVSFHVGPKSNWYSSQLFYNSKAFAKDGTYTLKLKIHSSVAGKIRVNGQETTLVAGDNEITVTGTNGMLSIQMAMPATNAEGSTNWDWGCTDDSVSNGDFTISDISWTAADGTVYGLDGKIS